MAASLVPSVAAVFAPNPWYFVLGATVVAVLLWAAVRTHPGAERRARAAFAGLSVVLLLTSYLALRSRARQRAAGVVAMLERADVQVTVYSHEFPDRVAIAVPLLTAPDSLFGRPVAHASAMRDSIIWLSRAEADAIARLWAARGSPSDALAPLSRRAQP